MVLVVIASKVKVTGNFFVFFVFFTFLSLMLHSLKYVLTHLRLGIWIRCQIWGTPIVLGVFLSKVKAMSIFMDYSLAIILTT